LAVFRLLQSFPRGVEREGARPRGCGTQGNTMSSEEAERLFRGGLSGEAASIPRRGGVLSPYVSVGDAEVAGQNREKEGDMTRRYFWPLSQFALR
jgi:hypothetical protein